MELRFDVVAVTPIAVALFVEVPIRCGVNEGSGMIERGNVNGGTRKLSVTAVIPGAAASTAARQ